MAGFLRFAINLDQTPKQQLSDFKVKEELEIIMLSGDRQETADTIAKSVGIDPKNVTEMSVRNKKLSLSNLQNLVNASLWLVMGSTILPHWPHRPAGIAMAWCGAASEVASIVLLGIDYHRLWMLSHLSTKTLGKIKQNLAWAFGYNIGYSHRSWCALTCLDSHSPERCWCRDGRELHRQRTCFYNSKDENFPKKIKTKILIREREREGAPLL